MKNLLFPIWVILVFMSCSEKKPVANPQVLIEADQAFSDYSVKHGYQSSFIEFADDSLVLLHDNSMPIVGKQNLIKSYEGKSDSGIVLTWTPAKAVIAKSGELGYTYGFWRFVAQKDTTQGTYMTVWKSTVASIRNPISSRHHLVTSNPLFFEKLIESHVIIFLPAFSNVSVSVIRNVGLNHFHDGSFFVGMKFDGNNRFFVLVFFSKKPFLNNFMIFLNLNIKTIDAFFPK